MSYGYFPDDKIEELLSQINNIIAQNKNAKKTATVSTTIQVSPADELKKFKELLDAGVITQEEFDAKKKQLLGL